MPKNVVYTPTTAYKKEFDTLIPKPDFFLTLIFQGTRIIRSVTATAAGFTNVYTVPAGKSFFLLNVQLRIRADPSLVDERDSFLSLNQSAVTSAFLTERVNNEAGTGQTTLSSDVFNFALPLRVTAGETIDLNLDNATLTRADCSIIGYLIDNSLLPTNI